MMKGIWYSTDKSIRGNLIDKEGLLLLGDVSEINISDEFTRRFLDIMNSEERSPVHKCISVYRDAVKVEGQIFNICLSCGDYLLDDEIYYLGNQQLEDLKQLKNEILKI